MILLGIGLLRLGWIIEFIPYIPISAFVTAAAITIIATQFPTLMGITGVNTREAPYLVIIGSLKGLLSTQVDAAIGLSSIVLLYAIRYFYGKMEVRYSAKQKMWAVISSLRLTFVMLLIHSSAGWSTGVAQGRAHFGSLVPSREVMCPVPYTYIDSGV